MKCCSSRERRGAVVHEVVSRVGFGGVPKTEKDASDDCEFITELLTSTIALIVGIAQGSPTSVAPFKDILTVS